MEILDQHAGPPPAGCVVSIGAYDGVHLGHQYIIRQVRSMAAELGCASAVVTFDRHPAAIVRPDSAPKLLTDLPQKLELLAGTGIDFTLVVPFDRQRSQESAEDFVTEVLVARLAAQAVVVGHDFHFGHARRGDVALLSRMGADYGFDVHGLRLVGDGSTGPPVSSTRIREALADGQVDVAAGMLGRNHEVRGLVGPGDGRGHELGFPTANIVGPDDICLPADGIYAGWYERPGRGVYPAALSLGRRPTFYPDAKASLLEAYILDFDDNLYGEAAHVRFITRLRGEERFESAEALAARIGEDVNATRRVTANAPPIG